ncbi:gfo/Idh/MocA family oxidoreductase [Euzebyella marina]|uniref:Gfo/Idh/MocA family oxidoreductase n=1 Tax=Euzebyella marina TaxID=1761453 RepID=A0A3G2L8T9_9FLAO|nr:Gfo/Idh/MocA family oxidoreductase [Euzebyella marina]AYN68633.1 gfo/Idh/MocA family oxidoreductase [Euzebyella marina]
MKKIKIALIGAGYIAEYHIRALQKIDAIEIAAIVARTEKSAQAFANKYKIENAFTRIEPILQDPSIEAVVLSTPNSLHAPHSIEFLKNGKDVFIEKPLATTAGEVEEIRKASEGTKKLVMVGHMWRFDEEAQYLKKTIESGKLGPIFKTKGYGIHVNWGPSGWFSDQQLAGGGALADMGVHAIDTVRFLLNDPKPVKVYARISTRFGDYDVDDTGIIVITWENGTESIIESGWWHPHMDGPEASTALFGTQGYANLFPTELKLKNGESMETISPQFPTKEEHCDQKIYDKQMAYFIECVKTRTQPVPGLEEGQVVLKIVDAAYASSTSGNAIDL